MLPYGRIFEKASVLRIKLLCLFKMFSLRVLLRYLRKLELLQSIHFQALEEKTSQEQHGEFVEGSTKCAFSCIIWGTNILQPSIKRFYRYSMECQNTAVSYAV